MTLNFQTIGSKFINSNKSFCCYKRADFYVETTKYISSDFIEIELKYQTEDSAFLDSEKMFCCYASADAWIEEIRLLTRRMNLLELSKRKGCG
jgi:hypothetical protein|tara:strand:+ start:346 stop:624 length:279 start_codon:yes stop_codon:yes gene_type:complete